MCRKAGWRKVFEALDKNKDGYLTRDEFLESLKQCNLHAGVEEIDFTRFIASIDANGDEKIDYEEYIQWVAGKQNVK